MSDANATLAAEGLPYVFRSFEVVGAFDSIGAYAGGARWKPVAGDAGGTRNMELPAPNVVVMFGARFPFERAIPIIRARQRSKA